MDSGYSLNFWPRRQIDYQTILDMAVGNGKGGGAIVPPSPCPLLAWAGLEGLESTWISQIVCISSIGRGLAFGCCLHRCDFHTAGARADAFLDSLADGALHATRAVDAHRRAWTRDFRELGVYLLRGTLVVLERFCAFRWASCRNVLPLPLPGESSPFYPRPSVATAASTGGVASL